MMNKRQDSTGLGLRWGKSGWVEQMGDCILSLCKIVIICSLRFFIFTLVLIFKKYCIKIVSWQLGFGAPLQFCAPNGCLAHLALFVGLEHRWDQQVAQTHTLTLHSSFCFPVGICLYHRVLAWTSREVNGPGVSQRVKPGKCWFSTGLLCLDLICH